MLAISQNPERVSKVFRSSVDTILVMGIGRGTGVVESGTVTLVVSSVVM